MKIILNEKKYTNNQITTVIENKVLKKGKKALYLVLKKKSFADEIIESLQDEIEERFNKFLCQIAPKLNNIKLDNEEDSLKYLLIKGLIKILNDMLKERRINLTEKDKMITDEIFENDQFDQEQEMLKEEPKHRNAKQYPQSYPQQYSSYPQQYPPSYPSQYPQLYPPQYPNLNEQKFNPYESNMLDKKLNYNNYGKEKAHNKSNEKYGKDKKYY